MRKKVRVLIRLRPGILDPQGKAIEENLPALGFKGVSDVRVGKLVEMSVSGEDSADVTEQVKAMSEALLANPVIEEYEIVLDGSGAEEAR